MIGTVFALCVSSLLCIGYGHSYLTVPEADWLIDEQPECRIGKPDDPGFENIEPLNCPGPCGEPGNRFSLTKGMTFLERGQKFMMKWTRNNHFGGFVRFTLVPRSQRMEMHVHEMFAFHFSCWEAGEVWCDGPLECGTDEQGLRYETEVEIPKVFPDGEYILGWTWYGGTRFRNGAIRSEYGDYYSCANVRINGGAPVEAEHKPLYIPGLNDKSVKKCTSSVDRMGICTDEPCKRDGARFEAFETIPHCFNQDSLEWESTYRIRSTDVQKAQNGGLQYVDPCNGQQEPLGDPDPSNNANEKDGSDNNRNINEGNEVEDNGDSSSGDDGTGGAPKLEAINLVDSQSGEIKNYDFNGAINVSEYKEHMTLRVTVSNPDNVSALKFFVNGDLVQTEGEAPFYIAGKTGSEVWPWRADGNPPLNAEFTVRIEVEGPDGTMTDSWTVFPEFQTF